ncbi:outer membrane receptor protein involved in Fe transport [Rhizobium halophytocola]|uniref:Outer membrane receptor protein involved in Fe transport n=1 Tax=Rhizobium halophytocola TaxID=735519 RepID=A0ABS4DV43_9HYPH|nr:outer membrane receptor protein involved in Fe transport [Rhizobium halophytocola]
MNRYLMLGVSAAALTGLSQTSAVAQGAAATGGETTELDMIVIKGEKVARSIQNTASSVSVVTDKDLARKSKQGASSVAEAVSDVPNVVLTDNVGAPVIRGQDTQGPNTGSIAFLSGTVPRATINVDGHYQNYFEYVFAGTSIWDVDSIEVFRGPQTTSQGANAIAGAIVVNTKDPTFAPEAAYQAEIGSYGQKRASVALSGPLYEDQLAGRLAIDYWGRGTFIDYINSAFVEDTTDTDFSSFNARAKLLWEPPEIPGLSAKFTYSHNDTNRPTQEAAFAPYDELENTASSLPTWDQKTDTGIFDLSYAFENGVTLYNQTQYSLSDVHRRDDSARYSAADIYQKNFSNENRVTFGSEEDVLSGVVGAYYAHTTADEALVSFNGLSSFDDTKDNFGLYSELSYRLTDQWTLTGGLRYQRDQVQRSGNSVFASTDLDYDETFQEVLPKLSLAYAVTPDFTVGALVNRGYNPGGVSINTFTGEWLDYDKETLWNYELFTRASLLDDRLQLTANVFYMDIKNAQRWYSVQTAPATFEAYALNAEKAHAYGLELGGSFEVLDNLTLTGSAGVLRTEIDEMSELPAYEGNEFQQSPGYMLSFGASWDITEKWNLAADIRHLDGYYSDDSNSAVYATDAYTIANVSTSYAFNDSMQVYGYVKNIFDERSATYLKASRSVPGQTDGSITAPRTFGIGIRGTF